METAKQRDPDQGATTMAEDEAIARLMSEYRWSREQIEWGIRAGFRCEYCGRDLLASVDDYDACQADHVYPQSKGGSNADLNRAISCKTCNFMKRDWVAHAEPQTEEERAEAIRAVRAVIAQKRAAKQVDVAEVRRLAHVVMNERRRSP